MANPFGNIAEQIERNKSKITNSLEEATNIVKKNIQEFQMNSSMHLKNAQKKSMQDIKNQEKELLKDLIIYNKKVKKTLSIRQNLLNKKEQQLLIPILGILVVTLLVLLIQSFQLKEQKTLRNWLIPSQYRLKQKNGRYIAIPSKDLSYSKKNSTYYLKLED